MTQDGPPKTVRVPADLWAMAHFHAFSEHLSVAEVVRTALDIGLATIGGRGYCKRRPPRPETAGEAAP